MKSTLLRRPTTYAGAALLAALLFANHTLADTDAAPSAANDSPKIPVAEDSTSGTTASVLTVGDIGYYWVNGNKGRFQQDFGAKATSIYGGLNEFNYAKIIDSTSNVSVSGSAEANMGDYSFEFKYAKDNWLSLSAGVKQFRTWYDGSGESYYNGSTSAYYPTSNDSLFIDRASFWIAAQTNFQGARPNLALRFERNTRNGTKSSTIEGATPPRTGDGIARYIAPAFYNINETVDLFTADITQNLDKLQWGLGVRAEHDSINNGLDSAVVGSTNTAAPTTNYTTDKSTSDMFSIHAFATGDLLKNLSYGAGADFTTLDTNLGGGSRAVYSGIDPIYDPTQRTPTSTTYSKLTGGTNLKQWTASANVSWRPGKNWTIVPSIRFQNYTTQSIADWWTSATANPSSSSNDNWFDATEAIEVRYTGFKNWTHTLTAEMLQGTGHDSQDLYSNTGALSRYYNDQDETRYTEKIAYSVNWYARAGLTFAGQYYYKYDRNYATIPYGQHTPTTSDTSNRYPGYIAEQGFETNDFNIRMTWRPWSCLTSVTRYDFQYSTVDTGYNLPGPLTGTAVTGVRSPVVQSPKQSGRTDSQIISENITYVPWHRISINANGSLVFDQTTSPAANNTIVNNTGGRRSVINSDNNYFNGGLNVVFVATDLDDIMVDYIYYRTWNFVNNAPAGLPYGQDEKQHIIALEWTRRFTAYLNFNIRYTYANYNNTTASNLNYHANGIYGKVQYKF